MLKSAIVRLVELCTYRARTVIALMLALALLSAFYAVQHFAIATDIKNLFPRDLPWTQRAYQYMAAFPQPGILAVVEAPTPELTEQAAAKLTAALAKDHAHFRSVDELRGGPFFARNGLLFLPSGQLARVAGSMDQAAPLIGALASDPSLRGALTALNYGVVGAANGAYKLDALARPMTMAGDTVAAALAGRPASFSWQELAGGRHDPDRLRRIIAIDPVLQYRALQPGRAATDAVTQAARQLDLAANYQARVRLTGLVPINDGQFGALQKDAGVDLAVTVGAVLIVLWLALRSWQLIVAAAVCVSCGLAIAAALGLFLVGALNPISVAFFVLFVGLGVDFSIQFSVRYRAERHETGRLRPALVAASRKAGGPLALAAAATAIGFASFVPTSYRGLSELGEIAGLGMIVAFLVSITLLPALLTVLRPPPEPRPMRFAALAPVDRFLQHHRIAVVGGTLGAVVLASPLLLWLPFDFNPLHLQNPHEPAVATFLDLRKMPEAGANAVDVLAPSLAAAEVTAARVAKLPEVAQTVTLTSLIPADQDKKLALIRQMKAKLAPALDGARKKPPTDAENISALLSSAGSLLQVSEAGSGKGAAAAQRLAGLLIKLAEASPQARARATEAFVPPLRVSLADLRAALDAGPVTAATVPPVLKRLWLTPSGQARVEVLPKGDPDDTAVLRHFVAAVLKVAPNASGPGVQLYEAGNTIVRAFIEAGIFAIAAIFLLLLVTLRRFADVLMTLVPLMVAAVLTLELCVVIGLPLNFANIIALPLLLGVGVAFKIYYVMAWRRGQTAPVQSTLSRAVVFSALTTGTAFGSLALSSQPGMASMGELMGLALLCTMAAAVLFQPALMGPPRAAAQPRFRVGGAMPAAWEDEPETEEPPPRQPGRDTEKEPVSQKVGG
ncbi:MAG TPA: MMPL family transporter [Stellaceae bacterium]|nr:MMPL family transporter [Stellaceae bacterium]